MKDYKKYLENLEKDYCFTDISGVKWRLTYEETKQLLRFVAMLIETARNLGCEDCGILQEKDIQSVFEEAMEKR